MSRELTQIEKDALFFRLRERAKSVVKSRLKDKRLSLVTECDIGAKGGPFYPESMKAQIVEQLLFEGMVEGAVILQQMKDELNERTS
jgi:hypothetical protein